ncbi:unnamed protein product [Mytilus coruscus]|uniref:Uncharacterized protein n=1 Tax=Mytilus coruscus TaxID=42192 RepID=A0A6J8DIC7_MYTCO|nr:unnamed protein product [Mytilus coruscus]
MTSEDFFLQLGPDYKKNTDTLNEHGFTDVETICTMETKEDLLTMFPHESMPLGHRRKNEDAVKNLKTATSTKPCDNYSNNKEPCRGDEEKGSLSKIQEKQADKLKELNDKLGKALAALKEIDKSIPLPEPEGPYKNQTCSICHVRGHRSDGNKDRSHCIKEPCTSWEYCGRRDKHKPEVSRKKRETEKEIRDLNRDITEVKSEKEQMDTFAERSQSSFMHLMKPRLKAINPMKYSLCTNLLMKDLITLKKFYNCKMPQHDPKHDNVELPKALGFLSTLKRKSSFKIFDENNNATYESTAKTRCASPKKTAAAIKLPVTTCTITRPVSSDQAMSAQSSYQPNYMYPFMPYGYPQMYYYNPYYYNQYPQQPPMPTSPPPTNSPLPKGSPPMYNVTFICFIQSLTFFNRSLMLKILNNF